MLANVDIQKIYARTISVTDYQKIEEDDAIVSGQFKRIWVVTLIAIILTGLLVLRIVYLNTVNNKFLNNQINSRIERTQKIPAMRGTIVDRNGNPLAVSTPVASIWADPSSLDNLTSNQIGKLAAILGIGLSELNTKLNQKDKTFVYLKRAITPDQAKAVLALGIDGVYSIQEFKRFYPNGAITAHIVGFNNIDDRGADGIEYAKNKELTGIDGYKDVLRDRRGNVVENLSDGKAAQNGQKIELAIDNKIQYIAYSALKKQIDAMHAKAGSAVVLDAKTGEVLSMVNIPTYNPNNRSGTTTDMLKNRAVTNVYDPGSIIKPLVIAKALDDKLVTPQTVFNTHQYYVGPKLIKDDEPEPQLTVEGILLRSSDIGTSKIALKYAPKTLWSYYRSVGFGEKLKTGFPGETNGLLLNWKKWHPVDQALMSYGYGISVSLLQMAHAYTLFTNEGCILPVSFYKANDKNKLACNQLIKPQTADIIRSILAQNTIDGTGKNAQIDDYTAGGKTGTAQKMVNGHYSNRDHIASFVGFAPAANPRIIVAVMVDDPRVSYYAAAVAAPVFSQIAGPALHVLGVTPDKVVAKNATR